MSDQSVEMSVAIMGRDLANHLANDSIIQKDIKDSSTRIETMLQTFITENKRSIERVHERIDGEAKAAREATAAVDGRVAAVDKRIDGVKIWTLGGALSGALGLIGFGAELAFKK